jgi:ubiquinone/menaquinone biosynthesis C-methylase UbiE
MIWQERLFRKLFPLYRHRWEVYNDALRKALTTGTVWYDIGCGRNELVAAFGQCAQHALGIDVVENPGRTTAPFLRADLRRIPLPDASADLITLRMVVEHLEHIPSDFDEILRLLKPDGTLIILTTNARSPFILFPRLLPHALKHWLIVRLFHVADDDVFPTFHRFNTPCRMSDGVEALKLTSLHCLEQVPLQSALLTVVFGAWYGLTQLPFLRNGRSSILAVFRKEEAEEISLKR